MLSELVNAPLTTVDDASKFFDLLEDLRGQGKPIPPINHVFFARVDDGLDFQPYHIRAVSKTSRPNNYYIVTKTHVVHVNRMNSTFETLGTVEDWRKESKMFQALRDLSFFRLYLKAKAINRLMNALREKKFKRSRTLVGKQLLLSHSMFSREVGDLAKSSLRLRFATGPTTTTSHPAGSSSTPAGRRVSKNSVDGVRMEAVKSLAIYAERKSDIGFTSEQFTALQNKHLRELKKYTADVLVDIVSIVMEKAKEAERKVASFQPLSHSKTTSVVGVVNKEVLASELREQERAQKRVLVAYQNVAHLSRLAHHMQNEAVFSQACTTLYELGRLLKTRDGCRNSAWFFKVDCVVENGTVSLFPHREQLLQLCRDTITKSLKSLSDIPTTLDSTKLGDPAAKPRHNATPLSQLFANDTLLQEHVDTVVGRVTSDYDEAVKKLPMYESFVSVAQFSVQWDAVSANWMASLASGVVTVTNAMVAEFRSQITKALRLQSEVKRLASRHYGVVYVACDGAISSATLKLEQIINDFCSFLRGVGETQYNAVETEKNEWVSQLYTPELVLEDYVSWVLKMQEAEDHIDTYLNRVSDLQNLFQLRGEVAEILGTTSEIAEVDLNQALKDPVLLALNDAKQFHKANLSKIQERVATEHNKIVTNLQETQKRLESNFSSLKANENGFAMKNLEKVQDGLNRRRQEARRLDQHAEVLEMQNLNWSEIGITDECLKKYQELWRVAEEAETLKNRLLKVPISEIDGQDLKDSVVSLFQRAFKCSKVVPGNAAEKLVADLGEEKTLLPLYVELCNPALKDEHWNQIFTVTKIPPIPATTRTLRLCEKSGLLDGHAEEINNVVSNAVGIFELEQHIAKIEEYYADRVFKVAPYAGRAGAFVIDGADEILEELEEQQVIIQTCLASKYVAKIKESVEAWEEKLSTIGSVIREWVSVQKAWMYLEFIFSSDDIKRQLPDESLLFSSADRFFSGLMKRAVNDAHVLPLCLEGGDALKKLEKCSYQLDCIQKKLDDYLETKRVAFPRFYFLSNDELLSILSDSRNPLAVQPHLQKCFDNIKELIFSDPKTITSMRSSEGEVVVFSSEVKIMGSVESWLTDVEKAMRETLFDRMAACVADYSHQKRTQWFFGHPAQCVSTTDQIIWTGDVERVITEMATNPLSWDTYMAWFKEQLLETVELVKRNLSSLERTVVTNLIVVDVHCRDVCTQLSETKTSSVVDFDWQKQLRFYWTEPFAESTVKDCVIRHGAAQLSYGYEYLGNQPRLVITPLTERAFLTCTAALHMQKGAAPQGPAGTGKTESVKDLGKALARQVVVFNCSDGLNYKMMSQMFAGLAQGGAWACFDEFNRIELEVLSVVAQQMLDITTAITNKQSSMSFEGHQIKLHPNFGVFITMNPGYAGRTELPDNLKALFRPICMMIPNYALIAEIMFYSEGYVNAGALAGKMVRLYSLASQQLSKQDHYDFGMRAVKSILVLAGRLKRAEPDTDEELLLVRAIRDANLPKFLTEDTQLFLALMRDFFPNVTEVTMGEANLIVAEAARHVLHHTMKLEATTGMLSKNQQLFDTLTTRHGLMLVGRTMTGKSTTRQSLSMVLSNLGKIKVGRTAATADPQAASLQARMQTLAPRYLSYMTPTDQWTCNPKSITMTELYGDVNPMTREWQDGVFSSIVRELVKEASVKQTLEPNADPTRHWVIFDGPVDAVWIENLNTVLDDSKMLCLVNGERIRIPETISLLFEVQDLRVASPATVSRCGMVYLDEEALENGWSPLLRSLSRPLAGHLGARWRQTRFEELCSRFLPALFTFLRAECKEYIATVNAQLARNMLVMLRTALESFVQEMAEEEEARADQTLAKGAGNRKRSTTTGGAAAKRRSTTRRRSSVAARASAALLGDAFFDALFIQSCVWGIGGNLADGSREKFSSELLRLIRAENLYFPAEAEKEGCGVYDYAVDMEVGDWRRWSELVPSFYYDASLSFFDLVVPTEHTVILNYLLSTASSARHHVLLNGLTGTAKSSTVANFLQTTLKVEDATSNVVAFSYTLSAQTSSNSLQETIESKLAKRKGEKELGPPHGKDVMVCVIDDCNVPQLEEYGAAPPIELLRQMISQGGFFDRKKLFFKEVVQTMVIACCGEPGGGKNEMTQRFTSTMLAFCVPQLSHDAMWTIYHSILSSFYEARSFSAEVAAAAGAVVDSTLTAYRRIAVECLPTPEKTHCTFNLRDVSKVVQGMLQVKPPHCETREQLISLWSHEASRVFHDRLVDDTDRAWWWRCVRETIEKHFATDAAATTEANPQPSEDRASTPVWTSEELRHRFSEKLLPQFMYGSWGSRASRDYQRITVGAATDELVYQCLSEYNLQSATPMDLVFFSQAVQHLSRICRIINQPRGHALLVGVGGSGRSSLCRLAATMMNMDLQTVTIVRGYGMEDFREEMRKALLDAGARGKEVVFLLSDPQIVCGEMLEDVNNVLNIGEVPGMMRLEDMEVIIRFCREGALSAGRPDTRSSIYQYFVARCRERMHVALCMSPMSGQFRDRLRKFPALVNCTTIDWFSDWPQDALSAVASAVLAKPPSSEKANAAATGGARRDKEDTTGSAVTNDEATQKQVGALMVFIHRTVKEASQALYKQLHRRNHTTPTNYLAALSLFQDMAQELRTRIDKDTRRYRTGLEKLDSANATVAQLKKQISDMQPVLNAAAGQAEEQKETVRREQADADVLKEEMSKEEAAAKGLMNDAEAIRQECEEGLAEAMPALEAAKLALETITAKDIQEIKTFTTPPGNVEKTMNAVLILLKEKEGWANAKTCLNRMDFLSRLTEYPRDEMSPAIIRKVAVFVNDPDFIPEVIEKTSLPCRSMCMWVHAMYKYYFIAKEVAPKRERLRLAEEKVTAARADLVVKQASLQKVLTRIEELEAAAQAAQAKADGLNREIETAKARLQRADQLTSGLASEKVRWTQSLQSLEEQRGRVVGTAALGAGCVAYLGAFTIAFRASLMAQWKQKCLDLHITFDESFALEKMMPEATIQEWTLQSLPRDTFSIQNATLMHRSERWCYMIDPQGQSAAFVRKKESGGNGGHALLTLKQTDDNFMRSIENAVQIGQPVLLEGVGESLDAALDPILLKQVRRVGGRNVVTLGDKEVSYDEHFRLYITTKLPNPVLTPELQVKVTVLNCTVTREGLEDQLLSDIVGTERAALQRSSDRCVVSIASSRQEIHALEEQVLRMLSEATGDVLDNLELISALRVSKATSDKIATELVTIEETNRMITSAREKYRTLAARGSLVYGVIANLAQVDPMYEYSLQFFKDLVISVLKATRRQQQRLQRREKLEKERGSVSGSMSAPAPRGKASGSLRESLSASRLRGGRGGSVSAVASDADDDDDDKDAEGEEEGEEDNDVQPTDEELVARVTMLIEELTWTSYRVVCRGLFERHKLLFSFLLATTIMKSETLMTETEWDVFLRGGVGRELPEEFCTSTSTTLSAAANTVDHRPAYMNSVMWTDFGALCAMPAFAAIYKSFFAEQEKWAHWLVHVHGEQVLQQLPNPIAGLSLWHQTMLLNVIRPDKLHGMVEHLVRDFLGERYTRAPAFSIRDAFQDSSKTTPIIFVLSPGADPTTLFTSFAEEMGFTERRYMLSLGQDQGPRAQKMIEDGRREGCWVYLQNCHVYASWMPRLQQLVEAINPAETHDDFRLWLTSSPSPAFPAAVLQAGMKLTREPPLGLKGKVRDTLSCNAIVSALSVFGADAGGTLADSATTPSANQSGHSGDGEEGAVAHGRRESLKTGTTRTLRWRRLAFSLAMLHGIALERRAYGPLGWNIPYEWGSADYEAGLSTITTALSRLSDALQDYADDGTASSAMTTTTPYAELTFMLGTIDYGGRVTDMWDTRCLEVIAKQFFSSQDGGSGNSPKESSAGWTSGLGGRVPALPDSVRSFADLLAFVDAEITDGVAQGGSAKANMFGLHGNADISVDRRHSAELIECLVRINAGGSGGEEAGSATETEEGAEDGASSDGSDGGGDGGLVMQVARSLLQRLPKPLPHIHISTDIAPEKAPLQTLLSHESDLYNRLIREMTSSLTELVRALKGEEVMTSKAERMATRLSYNQVPDTWRSVGYLSLKPLGAYFEDFLRRIEFIDLWRRNGPPPSFWLPGLFFPQGFVTAVLQARSRALKVPIDSLHYRFRVLSPSEGALAKAQHRSRLSPTTTATGDGGESNADAGGADAEVVGAYVHGLYLEGCGWDEARGGLVESRPGALTTELPVIHFEPVPVDTPPVPGIRYECPLYKRKQL